METDVRDTVKNDSKHSDVVSEQLYIIYTYLNIAGSGSLTSTEASLQNVASSLLMGLHSFNPTSVGAEILILG